MREWPVNSLCVGGGLVVMGVFVLMGIAGRWQWFRDNFRVRLTFDMLGDRGGTVFYLILSGTLLVLGGLICLGRF